MGCLFFFLCHRLNVSLLLLLNVLYGLGHFIWGSIPNFHWNLRLQMRRKTVAAIRVFPGYRHDLTCFPFNKVTETYLGSLLCSIRYSNLACGDAKESEPLYRLTCLFSCFLTALPLHLCNFGVLLCFLVSFWMFRIRFAHRKGQCWQSVFFLPLPHIILFIEG